MDLTTAPAAGAEGLRTGSERNDLLSPGRNCWRIERAARLAVIVDAARYFAAAKAAIRQARRSVMLIGWQFDLRTGSSLTASGRTCPTSSAHS